MASGIRGPPRAIRDEGRQLPGLEELGEAPRPVAGPGPAREVGILLHEATDVVGLLHAVEEVGAVPVRSGPARHHQTLRAQAHQALQVRAPVRPAAGRVVRRGVDRHVVDDHGVTQPPENGITWPTKKSASSEARYTARRADSSLRASRPAGMFRTMRSRLTESATRAGGK